MKPTRPLSPRELEVAACMGRGLSYPAASRELGISERTVRQYVARIHAKLPAPAGPISPQRRVMLWAAEEMGVRARA